MNRHTPSTQEVDFFEGVCQSSPKIVQNVQKDYYISSVTFL